METAFESRYLLIQGQKKSSWVLIEEPSCSSSLAVDATSAISCNFQVFKRLVSEFSETLENQGMQKKIVDDNDDDDDDDDNKDDNDDEEAAYILRSTFVDEVQRRMRRSRGRELPGTFNPLIVGDLFYLQSKPWESIVTGCIDQLLEDVQKAIVPMLRYALDGKSRIGLTEHVLNPALDKIEESLRKEAKELLTPQQSGHPITYNHYFTDSV
jgi:hypothetical protein